MQSESDGRDEVSTLLHHWQQLGTDERGILLDIAARLLQGQDSYGLLDLRTDRRDWVSEAYEEAEDLLVYLAAERRKRLLRGS